MIHSLCLQPVKHGLRRDEVCCYAGDNFRACSPEAEPCVGTRVHSATFWGANQTEVSAATCETCENGCRCPAQIVGMALRNETS